MIRQFHRMSLMDNSKLTKQIFLWDKTLNEKNKVSTWASEVKSLFKDCNLSSTFEMNHTFNLKHTVSSMKECFLKTQKDFCPPNVLKNQS